MPSAFSNAWRSLDGHLRGKELAEVLAIQFDTATPR
jgi:hypothetical protein